MSNKDESKDALSLLGSLDLHIETEGQESEIDFSRLMELLDGYKDIVLALNDSSIDNVNDHRTNIREREDLVFRLAPAREGSYAQLLNVYKTDKQTEIEFSGGLNEVTGIIGLVQNNDVDGFRNQIKSPTVALRALEGVKKVLPKEGEIIRIKINDDDYVLPKDKIIDFDAFKYGDNEYLDAQVNGQIVSVDFENKQMKIKAEGSGKKFSVRYCKELEEQLLRNRKELMSVKCQVRYDIHGNIADIKNADGLEELVLLPIEIEGFESNHQHYSFASKLIIQPTLDETKQIFIAEYKPLELLVYAEFLEDLIDEILYDIMWKWDNFVASDENNLADDAIRVREELLKMVRK